LTKVDQSGSLGVVGDVFEVMAQVDRRLTKVNSFDRIIRVNNLAENLGRHTRQFVRKNICVLTNYWNFIKMGDNGHIGTRVCTVLER
jgi:hypothetical protein